MSFWFITPDVARAGYSLTVVATTSKSLDITYTVLLESSRVPIRQILDLVTHLEVTRALGGNRKMPPNIQTFNTRTSQIKM